MRVGERLSLREGPMIDTPRERQQRIQKNRRSAGEERGREFETDCLCGFHVEDQLEPCGLFDRKLRRSRTLQDPIHKVSSTQIEIGIADAVGEKPAVFNKFTRRVDRRYSVLRSKLRDQPTISLRYRVDTDCERVDPLS